MNAQELRALQAPIKAQFREQPETARQTLQARALFDGAGSDVACRVETKLGIANAGLHPATGGDGTWVCSAEALLEALVGCAGVALKAVATTMELPISGGSIVAEGDLDFRGTLGVDKSVPIGFTAIRLRFDIQGDVTPEQKATLIRLTERYCVVLQTLRNAPTIEAVSV